MDNKGEGGTLALMALAQRALGRRTALLFIIGVLGAALFYGDAMITPAISVLSAVEGLALVPGLENRITPALVLAISHRHSDRRVRGAKPRHRPHRRAVRPDHPGLVSHHGRSGRHAHEATIRKFCSPLNPYFAVNFMLTHPGFELHRAGLGVSRRHRRGGALRRHGPFRPQPDPRRVDAARAAVPDAELFRPRRAGARASRRRIDQSVLRTGAGLVAPAARDPRDCWRPSSPAKRSSPARSR